MNKRQRMLVASTVLILTGSCLLTLVGGLLVYGRFAAWVEAQPRALVSTQMVWPDVPPLTPLPSPTPLPTPVPTPTPAPQPPVWIEIPGLGVERTIVPVGTVLHGEQLEWDTDSLFATSNRRDLVGHLEGTANPGQRGNVVLIGHNYNRGLYNWRGVFYALNHLQPGDLIHVLDQDDERFTYQVERVDTVTWQARSTANTLAHINHLAPTQDETLTLVTCGGANFAPFPNRLYVTAKRVDVER
jgi:LPXTG-site transpeptidase (sortase) family protein